MGVAINHACSNQGKYLNDYLFFSFLSKPPQACRCPLYWKRALFIAAGGASDGVTISVSDVLSLWRRWVLSLHFIFTSILVLLFDWEIKIENLFTSDRNTPALDSYIFEDDLQLPLFYVSYYMGYLLHLEFWKPVQTLHLSLFIY